ncbi:MAG: outer membrane protein assembly factor BamC [Azoarcus sp.]|jgi:outer membrane protein assembly factor BamC|nr:outer membrane protein assembly factor BamC [Azoarcus sp.]
MNRFPRFSPAPAFVLALALTGCYSNSTSSLLESRRIDYKAARPSATLEVPPDLTAPKADDRFTVPDVNPRGVATYSDYSAERTAQPAQGMGASEILATPDNMHIERAGNQRWLVVRGAPEQIWPQLRDFWLELGFVFEIDSPEIGVLETDWRENRANIQQDVLRNLLGRVIDGLYSTPERDKFRTRIEKGADGTVEIYISHRGMMEIYPNEAKDATVWQPRPVDPELEAEMLRRLMVRLGADETRAASALAAVAAPQAERAQVQVIDGQASLQVDEPFDRAWRRIGLALDRVSFTVEDRDRAKGLYYVRYVDPETDNDPPKEKRGFLSKLLFWRGNGDKVENGGEYRLLVEGRGAWSAVTVLGREGDTDQSPTARRILSLLQQELR